MNCFVLLFWQPLAFNLRWAKLLFHPQRSPDIAIHRKILKETYPVPMEGVKDKWMEPNADMLQKLTKFMQKHPVNTESLYISPSATCKWYPLTLEFRNICRRWSFAGTWPSFFRISDSSSTLWFIPTFAPMKQTPVTLPTLIGCCFNHFWLLRTWSTLFITP